MSRCPRICKEHKGRTTRGFGSRRDDNSGNQQRGVLKPGEVPLQK